MRSSLRSAFLPAFTTSAVAASEPKTGVWNVELLLRYAAATATTWIALAGAQLLVPTNFAVSLAILSLLGVPVSLYLRFSDMKVAGVAVPRPLWNSLTVVGTVVIGSLFLWPIVREMILMWSSQPQTFWLRFGAGDSLGLLMQAFLVFAALRSFAIISDKDATLTTIPSFSVLLLLIPVHQGIEVVCYFLAWTLVATMLFALDHRSELSAGVIARVPSPVPGQDVRLAARSLIMVLAVSLVAAIGISAYLTSRNPEDRSEAESAITSLAARLTQFALSLPDGSVNSGPERQIDFSSGPNLPSQAELWNGYASTINRRFLRPSYWRLFSLSVYNGSSWSQATGRQRSVKQTEVDWIPRGYFPFSFGGGTTFNANGRGNGRNTGFYGGGNPFDRGRDGFFNGFGQRGGERRREDRRRDDGRPDFSRLQGPPRERNGASPEQQFRGRGNGLFAPPFPFPGQNNFSDNPWRPVPGYPGVISRKELGFAVGKVSESAHQYGGPTELVRIRMSARNANLGYIPTLPGADALTFRQGDPKELRVSLDGATDAGVMQPGDMAIFTGQIPRLVEYGFRTGVPPTMRVPQSKTTPQLDAKERALNLRLPPTVTKRTRDLGARAMLRADKNASNFGRAQRLAQAIQMDAVYTLRPPATPEGRDATDFFLFDGAKRGYCTYFAGALTVLCRSQGIPARVVSGFASPEYVPDGQAIIRDANAHAWTEVWVENWGWAVVDATPADDRGDNSPTWIESWSDWAGATLDSLSRSASAHWPFLAAILGTTLLLVMRWKRQKSGLTRRGGSIQPELQRREITLQYERMSRLLARRFRPRATWETPDEWLAAAQAALPHLPLEALRQMTQLYLQSQFSPRPLHEQALVQAQEAVKSVRNFQWRQKPALQSPVGS